MDENKLKKEGVLEKINLFFNKNQKTIIALALVFFLIFVIILILLLYFQKQQASLQSQNNLQTSNSSSTNNNLNNLQNNLFPSFTETNNLNSSTTENADNLFDNSENTNTNQETLTPLELRPVAGFTVVNTKSSIKNYITKKPTSCLQKIEVAKKDEVSENVNNVQKTLASWPGIVKQEITGKLDGVTRDNLYILQKRYSSIIYQNKVDKTPSRVIDKETAHFINILCGFDKEADNEFVYIPVVRYALKETGEIIEFNTKTKEKAKYKSNNDITPEEVLFSDDGNFAIYRLEDEKGIIKTKVLNIKNSVFFDLEDNIKTITFSPSNKIAYGVKSGDNLNIFIYDIYTQKVGNLTSLPLTEWFLDWVDDNNLRITSKPSGVTEGISMTLDIKNKKFIQDISPILGLNTKNLSSKKFTLVQTGGLGNSKLLLLNNETKNLSSLEINSFIEKCSKNIIKNGIFCAVPSIINKVNLYPDDWYKGKLNTQDKIIYVNFEGGNKVDIAGLDGKDVSVKDINVSNSGVYFQDSKNLGLYILTIN
jgi:hypothetical protein